MACIFWAPWIKNDVNVWDRSPFVQNILSGAGRNMTFTVNGKEYDHYYLLADGIYPQWSCFVQSIQLPGNEKRAHFAKRQEACMKDVECCFGVLQGRFAIISKPCRGLSFEDLLTNTVEMEDEDTHFDLRGDLIEHLWAMKGANTWA
jgi:hypothetical protein